MIEPDMATLITLFVHRRRRRRPDDLDRVFRRVMDRTFNALSIDTDTSTSDTAAIMAGGRAGPVDLAALRGRAARRRALAHPPGRPRRRGRDDADRGTGVRRRRDEAQAKRVAKAIVNSPLVKTAVHGADPELGPGGDGGGQVLGRHRHRPADRGDLLRRAGGLSAAGRRRRPRPRWPSTCGPTRCCIQVSLGTAERGLHGVRLRSVRPVRPHQRGLHDVTGPRSGPSKDPAPGAPRPPCRLRWRRVHGLPGGARLWVKRDDLTGLGMGGNKARKLELAAAERHWPKGADTLVTVGAGQSNHCRMTAAAGARLGLPVHLVLGGEPPAEPCGNQLLSALFGAHAPLPGRQSWDELEAAKDELAAALAAAGARPYAIPMGGSTPVGAAAFVAGVRRADRAVRGGRLPAARRRARQLERRHPRRAVGRPRGDAGRGSRSPT